MEALLLHGVNVIRLHMASIDQGWYIVGCYLASDDASTIEDAVAAISQRPCVAVLLVIGDFKSNLAAPEGHAQEEENVVALCTVCL